MGRPIGGPPVYGCRHSIIVTATDVSVGPYTLKKRRPCCQRLAVSAVTRSPPVLIVRKEGTCSGGSTLSSEGGRSAVSTHSLSIRETKPMPDRLSSSLARHRVAPA